MGTYTEKPDFDFRRNGRVHLNRREASVQSTTGSRSLRISDSNARYTMFRGSVKSTGYLLHSSVFPSLHFPSPTCVTVCHHISTGLYKRYLLAGKGDRCVGLTNLPPSCTDCHEIWEPQPPGTLRACNGTALEVSWNVMAHAQKPVFFFRLNGRVHLYRRGCVSSVDCWQPGCAYQR